MQQRHVPKSPPGKLQSRRGGAQRASRQGRCGPHTFTRATRPRRCPRRCPLAAWRGWAHCGLTGPLQQAPHTGSSAEPGNGYECRATASLTFQRLPNFILCVFLTSKPVTQDTAALCLFEHTRLHEAMLLGTQPCLAPCPLSSESIPTFAHTCALPHGRRRSRAQGFVLTVLLLSGRQHSICEVHLLLLPSRVCSPLTQ